MLGETGARSDRTRPEANCPEAVGQHKHDTRWDAQGALEVQILTIRVRVRVRVRSRVRGRGRGRGSEPWRSESSQIIEQGPEVTEMEPRGPWKKTFGHVKE